MINLFDETLKIKKSVQGDTVTFIVDSKDDSLISIDWNKCKFNKVIINILENTNAEILELNEANNIAVEINIHDNSSLNHSIASFDLDKKSSYIVNVNENSNYQGAFADFSIGQKRFDFVCNLLKPYARATWNLASLSTKNDNKTFYVSFYHKMPHTYARMENYGVCEDESSLNFLGTSKIEKGAPTSATHQSAKIMVFDKNCKAKASPILCIDENDVEASHAAVVGQINEEHIFYLTSRGILEDEAKKLITLGYLNPILNFFSNQEVLEQIKESIQRRF